MKCLVLLFLVFVCSGLGKNNPRKQTALKDSKTFKYFTNHDHDITIPIVIHLDNAQTHNLSKEYKTKTRGKLKNKFEIILREVAGLYKRPSLNQTVVFKLIDVKFLKNTARKSVLDENASKYLGNYCRWQGKRKEDRNLWYYSVMFTGLDLYSIGTNNKLVRSSTGRSYTRGLCSFQHSCSVIEWQKSYSAFVLTLAHEIGHSLGMFHDGLPESQCRGHHFMGAKYFQDNPAKTWSVCSKRDFDTFMASRLSWCVRPTSSDAFTVY